MTQLWYTLNLIVFLSEFDTGALLNLINKVSYELITQPGQAALEQLMVNLRIYTGEVVRH